MRRPNSTNQPQLSLDEKYTNRNLFADHFLTDRLTEVPEWQAADGLQEAFTAILRLYQEQARRFTNATNEAQTEHGFIQPVLDLLWQETAAGDCYQVQVSIPNLDTHHRQPDYAFFRHAADRAQTAGHEGTADFWRDVPCLGDAKRWSASLDKERAADENPSAQIANYLYRSRVRWGILTNGRHWRLYEQDKSRAGGVYFEVDLEAILQHQDVEDFRYFWLFFRRQAHIPDAQGKTFLDKVVEGSVAYATQVQDSLKESVYDALRLLMTGFCELPDNQLDARDEQTRKLVHENALILLYRLLFILYAEDRRLLPHDDEHYEGYSLRALQQELNRSLRANRHYLSAGRQCWSRLCDLFRLIDEGFEHEGQWIIPAYNGGLFSPDKHPHIAYMPHGGALRWEIGDNRLAEVIDMLAYQRDRWDVPGTQDVDYATLAVQHLGSIYEGLLELQPQVAEMDLIEATEDGKVVFKPAAEVPNPRNIRNQSPRRVRQGEVYLTTNRGERKATGSYYTPSYIVDYIVEHTVGPLATAAAEKTAELLPQIRDLQARSGKATKPSTVMPLQAEIADLQRDQLNAYLSLKILDPAMGSGHFLVGAADFLSLAMATDPSLPPVDSDEDEQVHYKRLIVERCLYGVDLNSLAVELAKLSLWLHTVSRNKALSFLDHHLRCGNSLIGAWIERDLTQEPPQFNARGRQVNARNAQLVLGFRDALMHHIQHLLSLLGRITTSPSSTAADEHAKELLYQELERERDRFRQVAHCWLAPFFGIAVTPAQYQGAVDALRAGGATWDALAQQEWFVQAQARAQDEGLRFFHWELEFPESFLGARGLRPEAERGFDAVVGNPPYVRPHHLEDRIKSVLWARFRGYVRKSDLLNCFIEQGLLLTVMHGHFGMITSDTWRILDSSASLRGIILARSAVQAVWLLPLGVFEDAHVKPVVVIARREADEQVRHDNTVAVIGNAARSFTWTCPQRDWTDAADHLFDTGDETTADVRRQIARMTDQLGSLCVVDFGLKTADDAMFLNRTGDRPEDRALIASSSVQRYFHQWGGDYVWYRPDLMRAHRTTARPGEPERFERPKVMLSRMAEGLAASFDDSGLYVKDALLVAVPDGCALLYLETLLNSRALNYWYTSTFTTVDTHRNEVMQLPIRMPDSAQPSGAWKDTALSDCSAALDGGDYALPLRLAEQALATHALLHTPAGKPELRDDPYWAAQIAQADPDFPGREDFVHDLLAALAQRMMDLNRQKHETAQEFLTWLEHTAGCQVDNLTNKTRLHEFWAYDDQTLTGIMRANRRRCQNDVEGRRFITDFAREHGETVAALTPILQALEQTDRLIDQIVYKLYGLTDEEIAIVEGTEQQQGE